QLADLRDRASALKDQADTELRMLQADSVLEKQKEQAQQALKAFQRLRGDALFLASQSNGSDPADNLTQAAGKARAALDLLTEGTGKEGPAQTVKFRVALSALPRGEREQAEADVYELLLILAEAVARPPAGAPAAGREDEVARLDHALRLLDRARSLGLRTLALAARRAEFLDRV